jgi:hypothetical protein
MARAYLIFHLNLAFSSIPEAVRPQVIEKCYWPLLELIDRSGIRIGVELTGWTLQQIEQHAPDWVERFRALLHDGRCELLGSGWSQSIGPLMPHVVNVWNQRLGVQAYVDRLGTRPAIALVNEMAFSTSMVDLYGEAGYRGMVMDRDNVRLALGLDHLPLSETPTHAQGCGDRVLPVLWSDSILFQRLQRAVHGDIPVDEYLRYVARRAEEDGAEAILPVYCNDAEIFDYRPGRFAIEPRIHDEGEWIRLERILTRLTTELGIDWLSPSAVLDVQARGVRTKCVRLSSASHPIPVKKQPKYNLSRWAVTGRDDLWLNTLCHRMARQLDASAGATDQDWRSLCEFWASDFRTHISEDRWQVLLDKMGEQEEDATCWIDDVCTNTPLSNRVRVTHEPEGVFWEIHTRGARMVLNARRGLTIHSLAFAEHDFEPILGTLNQGYFNTISMAADFYSGGVVIEVPGDRWRLTDLEWVEPTISEERDWLRIHARLPLGRGVLVKEIAMHLNSSRLRFTYCFEGMKRPLGVVRVGKMTLFSDSMTLPLRLRCHNGGAQMEEFVLDERVGHGQAVSSLVSSQSGLGATQGELSICGADGRGVAFSWLPDRCAALPMLTHEEHHGKHFTRLAFSLSELDDTSRPGGHLLPFSLDVTACG